MKLNQLTHYAGNWLLPTTVLHLPADPNARGADEYLRHSIKTRELLLVLIGKQTIKNPDHCPWLHHGKVLDGRQNI